MQQPGNQRVCLVSNCLLLAAVLSFPGHAGAHGDFMDPVAPVWGSGRLCDQQGDTAALTVQDRDAVGIWRGVRERLFPNAGPNPSLMHMDKQRNDDAGLHWGVRVKRDQATLTLAVRW